MEEVGHGCVWLFLDAEEIDQALDDLCDPEALDMLGMHWVGLVVPHAVRMSVHGK